MSNHITTPYGVGYILAYDTDTDKFKVCLFDSVSIPDPLYKQHREHGGIWIDKRTVKELNV